MGAMVDHISGGRLTLGIGAASFANEHAMYNIPFPPPAERVRRIGEACEVIRRMWSEERASFEGRYYRIEEALLEPKPTQRPLPPILIASRGGRLGLRIVAQYADIYHIAGDYRFDEDTGQVQQNLDLDAACAAIDRDPAVIERAATALHSFSATLEQEQAKQAQLSKLFGQPFDAMAHRTLSGPPEQIVEQVQRYVDAGISHLMISLMAPYDLDGLKIFAEKVIPRFR
jgi:alkanesulfonate monooxygenase SsuD/methylene tetrahydromethanopterin reductase-like flavin-dependent oxidoreductase (luciferase family)